MNAAIDPGKASAAGTAKAQSQDGWRGALLKLFIAMAAIVVVAYAFSIRHYSIPSGSMAPTVQVGDYVTVTTYSYGVSNYSVPVISALLPRWRLWPSPPHRGDIVVFKRPKDNVTDYIKRVIGLPGDRIQMKQGRLYINGVMVQREQDGTFKIQDAFGRTVDVPQYIETLPNGIKHPIIEIDGDKGPYDDTQEYVVPPAHYFMMGDNRDNSEDSRMLDTVGYVPFDNFVGKAQVVSFSVADGWMHPTRVLTWLH